MSDLIDRLSTARPTEADLTREWSAADRQRLAGRVFTDGPAHSQHGRARRVRRALALGVAAAVAAVVVVPQVVGGQSAQARERLLELSAVAAAADTPLIEPGTFLHVRSTERQRNSQLFGDGARYDTDHETWVAWDGEQWRYDRRPSAGWTEAHHFPSRSTDVGVNAPTPQFVASLPADPDELRAHLDEHVQGSNSHEEALFVAVTDLLRSHLLPPAKAAVAIRSLVGVDGVETRDVTVDGRDAVEISYTRFVLDVFGTESVIVDRATAQVLAARSSDPGGTYEETATLIEVVGEVPARITRDLAEHGSGARICADGTEADGDGTC